MIHSVEGKICLIKIMYGTCKVEDSLRKTG